MKEISIVLPCFNEEENIPKLFEIFNEIVIDDETFEIIFVDNGSTDKTSSLLLGFLKKYKFAKSIRIENNKGYGNGIFEGLKICEGRFIGWTHADLQTSPRDLLKVLDIIQNCNNKEKIFIKGNRINRDIKESFFSIGMSFFESLFFAVPLWEINAQPTIFSRNLFDDLEDPPKDFSFDLYTYIIALKRKYQIIKFDVNFGKRIYGFSKWNINWFSKFKFIKRTLFYSIKLKKKFIFSILKTNRT